MVKDMKQKLSPIEQKLYQYIDEILHHLWDPIGVRGIAGAEDEYQSYVPKVFSLVLDQAEHCDIAAYLVEVEENGMGLPPNQENALEVAKTLLNAGAGIFEDDI